MMNIKSRLLSANILEPGDHDIRHQLRFRGTTTASKTPKPPVSSPTVKRVKREDILLQGLNTSAERTAQNLNLFRNLPPYSTTWL